MKRYRRIQDGAMFTLRERTRVRVILVPDSEPTTEYVATIRHLDNDFEEVLNLE